MDYDSSSKFISSLAKFLQSLCNGYVEFDSGVQVIGHLYLSVDTGKTIDYILNEKVCKTDENSVTFISNSFHAQPAERPKPPGKKSVKDSERTDFKNDEDNENFINTQGEPRSTNIGTMPPARNTKNSPHLQGAKRPFSPSHKSQPKTGQSSPRHKKSRTESLDQNVSQLSNPASENSISSTPSPAADNAPQNTLSVHTSDAPPVSHLNESYQQSYFHPDEESSLPDESEERDIKPSIDTDVTFIKEEYAPSSSCSQSGRDRTHVDESAAYSYQTNQVFPGSYTGQSGFGVSQRSNFNSSGSSHMFSPGQSSSKIEENSGDPSVRQTFKLEEIKHPLDIQDVSLVSSLLAVDQKVIRGQDLKKTPPKWTERPRKFTCHFCLKSFVVKRDWEGHINSIHLKAKPFRCYICSWSSSHRGELQKHVKKCSQMYGHLTEVSAAQQSQSSAPDDY